MLVTGIGQVIDIAARHHNSFSLLTNISMVSWGGGYGTGRNASLREGIGLQTVLGPDAASQLTEIRAIAMTGLGEQMVAGLKDGTIMA
jgi:hypothetical protein